MVSMEPTDEDEVIIRVINENLQVLIDSSEDTQKAIVRLQESLQALRDYHSKEIIQQVIEGVNGEKPF